MWREVVGLAGALAVMVCYGLGGRLLTRRRRNAGTAIGMLVFVVFGLSRSPASEPGWYNAGIGLAFIVAGFGLAARLSRLQIRQRNDPEYEPDEAGDSAANARHLLRRGGRDDIRALDTAVERFGGAVRSTSRHPANIGHVIGLVTTLRARYERRFDITDLDKAIEISRIALALPGRRSMRGRLLSQLSIALRMRYDHIGAASDLEEAHATGAAAVRRIPFRNIRYPDCVSAFGAVLYSEYLHEEDPRFLDLAIEQVDNALKSAGRRGYERTADLTTMCYLLVQRGRRTRNQQDLGNAVALGRRALELTPPGYALFEECQENLALALRTRHEFRPEVRHEFRRDMEDLGEAIRLAQRAVEMVPADAPRRAVHQLNLALALHLAYRDDGDLEKLDRAMTAAAQATRSSADVPTRVTAGLAWSEMAASAGRYSDAVAAFESVIELLPQLASGELQRADQENRLGRWTGIAVTAAACALADGCWEKAVTLLEQGRGVLLSRGLDVRADLTLLRSGHPRLAEEFDRLRAELDVMYEAPGASLEARDRVRRQRRLHGGRWEELLRRIRAEEGFEEFARAPSAERILAQGDRGPVVYLNVSDLRSDAIILDSGSARCVPLGIDTRQAEQQVRRLHSVLRPDRIVDPREHRPVYGVLAWLWDEVVEPVLTALDPRPARVWWVPTGPLALLPIHAAGHHDTSEPGESRSAPDRVISSYAPTVRALAAARGRAGMYSPPRPLIVAMPETPGAEPLSRAAEEGEVIQRLFPDSLVLSGTEATKERVLAELPGHTWAHFACHAVADRDIPSRGRLLLHDHEHRPLTVNDVSRLDLGGVELAYLSSCDSARTGSRHADEAINLASSFQLAGFPHVVATLWPVLDQFALGFAEDVYRRLAEQDTSQGADVALAVHHATRTARDRYPHLPGLWAGHVHVGP